MCARVHVFRMCVRHPTCMCLHLRASAPGGVCLGECVYVCECAYMYRCTRPSVCGRVNAGVCVRFSAGAHQSPVLID